MSNTSSSMHSRAQRFIPSPLPSSLTPPTDSSHDGPHQQNSTLPLLPRTTARLTLTILSHALYAKQILSQPVSLLRREKERARTRKREEELERAMRSGGGAASAPGVARRTQSAGSSSGSAASRKLEAKKEKVSFRKRAHASRSLCKNAFADLASAPHSSSGRSIGSVEP
jgi:hypothetical protein